MNDTSDRQIKITERSKNVTLHPSMHTALKTLAAKREGRMEHFAHEKFLQDKEVKELFEEIEKGS